MSKLFQYIKDSYTELTQHVSWSTWSELQHSAVLVLIASVIIALVVFAMDEAAGNLLKYLYESIV